MLAIWWCPCVESSLVFVEKGCLLWPVCSLGKTLLTFALLHFVFQSQTCLLLQVSLDFVLLHFSPLWWKGHLFWVLVLESLVGLYRTVQLQLLQHYWLGHSLRLLWYWMICLGNEQKSVLSFLRLHPSTTFWYDSKPGKISSGHRIGKGQFSFQSQRKAKPKNVQTTTQLQFSYMLVKKYSKFSKPGFNNM